MDRINEGMAFLTRALQLSIKLREALNKKAIAAGEIIGFRAAFLGLQDQAEGYGEAVHTLIEHNQSYAAIPIIRTLFEIYITTKLLNKDRNLVERYAAFSWVNKQKVAKTLRKYDQFPELVEAEDLSIDEIESECKKAQKKYDFRGFFWFPPEKPGQRGSIKSACIQTGDLEDYEIVYSYLSDIAHAGITCFHSYDFRDEGDEKVFSRLEKGGDYNAHATARLLLIMNRIFDDEFSLGLNAEIDALANDMRPKEDV